MFYTRIPGFAALASIGVILLAAAPALADMVVIRATGAALVPGQTVATGVSVSLPAGDSATLLARDGKTVTLTGPFSGSPEKSGTAGGDPKVITALSRLLTSGAADTHTLGVTRGVAIQDPYAINQTGGTHCQVAELPAIFKRGLALGEAKIAITAASGAEASAVWSDGADTATWPSELPFAEGTYMLRVEQRPTPVKLVVHKMPTEVKGPAATAAWMADHGCKTQALAVLNALQ